MRRSEVISRIFGLLVLALLLTWLAEDANGQATDTYIGACASQQSCTLATNVSWAGGNQVWRFTAFQPNESIRIWILNHNPTNAHTSQTVQVWITDDSTVPSLLVNSDRWVQACVTDNTTAGAQLKNVAASNPAGAPGANGKATGYTVGMYAVQIAVRITGAAAQAGNPDTFDIGIVQQPTTYPGGPQPGCDSSAGSPTTFQLSSAANVAAATGQFSIFAEKGPRWAINGTTSVTKAGAAGITHVVDCLGFSGISTAASTAANVNVVINDATAGNVWSLPIAVVTGAALGVQVVPPQNFCGLSIPITSGATVTCQFSATVTNTTLGVNCTGYDTK